MADKNTVVFRISKEYEDMGLTRSRLEEFAKEQGYSLSSSCSVLLLGGFRYSKLESSLTQAEERIKELEASLKVPSLPDDYESLKKRVSQLEKIMRNSGIEI